MCRCTPCWSSAGVWGVYLRQRMRECSSTFGEGRLVREFVRVPAAVICPVAAVVSICVRVAVRWPVLTVLVRAVLPACRPDPIVTTQTRASLPEGLSASNTPAQELQSHMSSVIQSVASSNVTTRQGSCNTATKHWKPADISAPTESTRNNQNIAMKRGDRSDGS